VTALGCPKFPRCPGCSLGGESYEVGLERKARTLTQALAAYTALTPTLLPARPASPTHAYRQRAKLVVDGRALGLFERGTHRVIDIAGCLVLAPELERAAQLLRELLPLPIYGADLRTTSEGVLVTLLTEQPRARSTLEPIAARLLEQGVRSVAISVRDAGNVRLLAGEPEVVAGPATARHRSSEALPYAYAAPGGFVQAHAGQASYVQDAIIARLREHFGALDGRSVLELFAGNGALALALSRAGARVTAVEAFAPAIALAERAASEQQLSLRAVAADATRFVQHEPAREAFDAVIVNPPRRGLAPELRRALGRLEPQLMAYVSCNPRTLARDCAELGALGLTLRSVEPLDMIPWSDAVEALAWLEPEPPPLPRLLHESATALAVAKSSAETMSALLTRVRRLPGARDAVPLEGWGEGVSGVCWFAKSKQSETELGEREVVVLVRGNLRKQGTITRADTPRGTRYKKTRDVGRHSLAVAFVSDADERALSRDFAGVGRPVLGDARYGDRRSNEHVEHRHGLDRPFVHCRASLLREAGGGVTRVESTLAADLEQVLESLDEASD
jgi:23S rRNA (uracil1939-C5)-methyltransferase